MPTTQPCNFTIPANSPNGSKLAGNGFNGRPTLQSGDSLQVIVRWGGNNPPSSLTGHFILSAAPAASNQTTPSPFVNGSKYVCHSIQTKPKDTNTPSYTFDPIAYGGGQPGAYALTFVVEDGSTTPATQWSRDPEFDTGN
jgi:hypothetical protein